MDTWIVLGATSSIARAFIRHVAESGAAVILAGRDIDDMERTATDARARGAAGATVLPIDMRDAESFAALVEAGRETSGTLNAAVFVGSMPPQEEIDADPALISGVVADSYTGPAQVLQALAPILEERGGGTVVGVGSVAGDRGRLGNYVYGSAKAGFHTYLAGLRNRLTRSGGHVVTVKPGFVDTAMTWGIEGMFLVASPDKVAADILKAARKKRNVIYTPIFWLGIMTIIKLVPEPIFKKLKI